MGLDIVGPFPKATRNRRWLIVRTNYFTKWVEAKPLANIRDHDGKKFVGRNIIIRFGVPHTFILDNGLQFDSKAFQRYSYELGIKNRYSTLAYPQSNGQAKATNKVVVDGLMKRLVEEKGRWMDELPYVLSAYHTTQRRSTRETLFSMIYGFEAVIPLETWFSTMRTNRFNGSKSKQLISTSLDLVKERKEIATVQLAHYQQKLKQGYNKGIKTRSFVLKDLVLRMVVGNTRNPTWGKLKPNWEWPYRITSMARMGAYHLENLDEIYVSWPWNVNNLQRYYY